MVVWPVGDGGAGERRQRWQQWGGEGVFFLPRAGGGRRSIEASRGRRSTGEGRERTDTTRGGQNTGAPGAHRRKSSSKGGVRRNSTRGRRRRAPGAAIHHRAHTARGGDATACLAARQPSGSSRAPRQHPRRARTLGSGVARQPGGNRLERRIGHSTAGGDRHGNTVHREGGGRNQAIRLRERRIGRRRRGKEEDLHRAMAEHPKSQDEPGH
ncbi:hypothetical protein PVAP13_3NG303912 [Panicum virgatum]|uniref:Uncharacterized protein n=1 Tax=Panicum virgatum TaxID=38727 RepID=A0A8T0UI59_PANVG|nr:hypothetical protein PVAP13_3NG303912 [Panicum virgatum]